MPPDTFDLILAEGPVHAFADGLDPALPRVAAGVYTIWRGAAFVYVGMSGQGLTAARIAALRETATRPLGLYDRLKSHRSGRRGGDQFCLYIGDRFVLTELTSAEVALVRDGLLSLDACTRDFIRAELTYRWVETPDGASARAVERRLRQGQWVAGLPVLNPLV